MPDVLLQAHSASLGLTFYQRNNFPDEYRGEAAKAFVKLRAGSAAFSLDELKSFLAGKLGRHEIPAALAFVDELPRTPVGKLSRHELRSQQAASRSAQAKTPQLATGGRP